MTSVQLLGFFTFGIPLFFQNLIEPKLTINEEMAMQTLDQNTRKNWTEQLKKVKSQQSIAHKTTDLIRARRPRNAVVYPVFWSRLIVRWFLSLNCELKWKFLIVSGLL